MNVLPRPAELNRRLLQLHLILSLSPRLAEAQTRPPPRRSAALLSAAPLSAALWPAARHTMPLPATMR